MMTPLKGRTVAVSAVNGALYCLKPEIEYLGVAHPLHVTVRSALRAEPASPATFRLGRQPDSGRHFPVNALRQPRSPPPGRPLQRPGLLPQEVPSSRVPVSGTIPRMSAAARLASWRPCPYWGSPTD